MNKVNKSLPSEWTETTLGEVTDLITRGVSPSYVQTDGITVLNQKCIRNWKVLYEESRLTERNRSLRSPKLLKDNDILICSTGVGTLGRVAQIHDIKDLIIADSHISIVRPKKNIDPLFLGYVLKGSEKLIETMAEGSTGQTELSRIKLQNLKIFIPNNIPTQEKIAFLMSSLDNKIELLQKQNKTLEDMAQALFKEWFVNFNFQDKNGNPYKSSGGKMIDSELGKIPEGWKIGIISYLANIIGGGTPKTDVAEYWNGDIGWLSGKDVTANDRQFCLETEKKVTAVGIKNSSAKLLPTLSTIISARGTVGSICLTSLPMCISQSNYALVSKSNMPYLIYFFLISILEQLKSNSYGAVFDTITTSTLNSIGIALPPNTLSEAFEDTIRPILNKKMKNSHEIQTLSSLIDTLLPKLMKGDIRI